MNDEERHGVGSYDCNDGVKVESILLVRVGSSGLLEAEWMLESIVLPAAVLVDSR